MEDNEQGKSCFVWKDVRCKHTVAQHSSEKNMGVFMQCIFGLVQFALKQGHFKATGNPKMCFFCLHTVFVLVYLGH